MISGVFTGSNNYPGQTDGPNNIPIPNGTYDVLDNLESTTHPEYFRLDRADSSPYNDRDDTGNLNAQGLPRDGFRLHLGQNSWGCVTINNGISMREKSEAMWAVMSNIPQTTSTNIVPNNAGLNSINPFSRDLFRFGTLTVK